MSASLRWTIALAPLLLVGVFSVFLAIPATRDATKWLLLENRPVEIATFFFLVAAGVASLYLAWATRRRGETLLTQLFYVAFGAGLILTGMEEIAWGQYWLGFETLTAVADLNAKGETTLHNFRGLDGRTEILRVLYGVGGLIGVWLNHRGQLPAITPPTVLWTWFAVIAVFALYDFANDINPLVRELDSLVDRVDELIEMLIGLSALIFVWLKGREFSARIPERDPRLS